MEVVAVLDLRTVGVAEFLVQPLLLGERVIALDLEGDVMPGAGAESPAALIAIRFVMQNQRLDGTTVADFEAVIRPLRTRLAKAERLGQEALLFGQLAYGQYRPEEAAVRDVGANLPGGPAGADVVPRFDQLEEQSRGVSEADELLAHALLDATVRHVVPLDVIGPEGQ